jgi:hypothetical protein
MPAKPRPLLDDRRVEAARRPRLAVAGFRARVRELLNREVADRDLLALDRRGDLFALDRRGDLFALDRDRFDVVSPFSRRILFTVLAATSSARPPYRPDFLALCLMCSYWRSRFGLAPRGI